MGRQYAALLPLVKAFFMSVVKFESILYELKFLVEDYFDGEYVSYSYDQEKATYSIHRSDTIAASYSLDSPLTEEEILSVLDGYSLENLKEQGFDLDDR